MWDETSQLGGTSHLSEILLIQGLHKQIIPPERDSLHQS